MSTAVWMVMCSEPMIFTPSSGFSGPYFSRVTIKPGISFSAMPISLRPKSANSMFRTV